MPRLASWIVTQRIADTRERIRSLSRVATTVCLAEWRVRSVEQTLRAEGPHGSSDEMY